MNSVISYEGRDLEALDGMKNYYSWILETFSPFVRGDVIEYGAGAGAISERLLPMANKLTLVEPSSNLTKVLHRRFAMDPRVAILVETAETNAPKITSNSVDTVVMVNVLEHIEDDQALLGQLIRMLKPGGHLLIFVPALRVLMSRLDRIHGHFRRYQRSDLRTKIVGAGGHVILCRYFDLLHVPTWFLLNTILSTTTFNPALLRISDSVLVPLSRLLERIVTPPFGKNLIAVAVKE